MNTTIIFEEMRNLTTQNDKIQNSINEIKDILIKNNTGEIFIQNTLKILRDIHARFFAEATCICEEVDDNKYVEGICDGLALAISKLEKCNVNELENIELFNFENISK